MKRIAIILLIYYEKLLDFIFLGLDETDQQKTRAEFSDMKAKLADLVNSLNYKGK